jgi:2-haloacid dehalogenase
MAKKSPSAGPAGAGELPKDRVKALLFDVFGTCVDWRSSAIRELTAFGAARGLEADWTAVADEWRGLYQPSMEEVRTGRRPFTVLDDLHRESLLTLLDRHAIRGLDPHEIEHLVTIWHRLSPWPDVVEGLTRLKRRYVIATCSNGNIRLMVNMAKHGGLPWDMILGAEIARAYKPRPEAYARSILALGLAPSQTMMVAAHNGDLAAASQVGMRTAFVARPTEYGPHQSEDFHATGAWDVVTDSFAGLASAMGCPATG